MKNKLKTIFLALCLLPVICVRAQQPAPAPNGAASSSTPTPLQKNIESFLRNYYALGQDVKITVGAPKEFGSSGILETSIEVKTPDGSQSVKMYITKDGRYLIRGEISDLTTDPLAETIARIQTAGAPALGDPSAPITLVEYSDFECPVCRGLHDALRSMLANYPQVKVVFKDFPLDSLHPWARTAALAGRCAYQQDPKAFWKLYDLIYDNQDIISVSNVWDKMVDYAGRSGLNTETFKACLTGPQAAADVDASIANGNLLEVHSTPTIFINGRRIVGADPHVIQQYIDYAIAQQKLSKPTK